MALSPITKAVVAIGLIGIPYFLFLAPDRPSVASVSEQVELLDPATPSPLRRPIMLEVPELPHMLEASDTGLNDDRLMPLLKYEAIVERPLFAVSRRPYFDEVEPVAVEFEESGEENWVDDEFIRLVGTFRQGDEMKAMISSSDYVELFTVGIGDEVSRWTLKEIKADQATLAADGESLILKLLD